MQIQRKFSGMSNYNCINSMGSDSTSYLDLWGSLNTFYSIANGVIDSMQESPNSGRQLVSNTVFGLKGNYRDCT